MKQILNSCRMATQVIIALLAFLPWLTGCAPAILQPEPRPANTYLLDATIEPRPDVRPSDKVLLVDIPQAQPGYDTRRIAYSRIPLALDYYTLSVWADTPARMLSPLVVRALERSGGFRAVMAAPTPATVDLRLTVEIIRLKQSFLEEPSQVQLAVRAKLFDVATRKVLATRLFEIEEPTPSEDAYGGVQAANVAVERLLEQLTDFVLANIPG